ncbi:MULTISPECIES: PP2C family protein-serine/threonine phosphatase [Streptomycetaceae]|uniref:Magnesium or manganese-dependent protein phosphatase n=1 Tax=Streptantibioticus cattleyicolor (strain ATCC 35852 / DSM 46488 / JCM 4925 / NBRC 14057 / NRRL 8057) TaxID=1003195 RepID=F8K2R0_STREN|nr:MULTISPECIES: PP2C family protein-serine/threonine phosphatase [Streptomycetaceae]AEW97574.1 magnesium or manganese-dependent protein phosphatase [Streptantibioticus cattleyicolor NRRL 8057 = DSM 46488]MYS62006.1 SpoIIE family protein phosphatase [Streptomyces sp. SID5468]CCB77899.1 Putative magnesium or manganese-dependent protein phosphatase (modular protein) [Streptantibioticus cattleyicolor NRRL 8057 = DSM 46488]
MIPTSSATGVCDEDGAGPGTRAGRWRGWLRAVPVAWIAVVVALEAVAPGGDRLVPLLAVAPAMACVGGGRRHCAVLAAGCAVLALVPLRPTVPYEAASRIGTALTVVAVITAHFLIAGRRARLVGELERTREIAAAAQQAVLRPLPGRLEGLAVAGDYLSASRGAQVGGDLYEVLSTPYGVRAVLGDVRGHGLAAIGTVAALLGSFREAAHDEADLGGVLARLDRAFARHLRERTHDGAAESTAEEFATLLLLEVGSDGALSVLNCGHPWPYLIGGGHGPAPWVVPLSTAEPHPPLGLCELRAARMAAERGRLALGQALFLHTDGAVEARDASGAFFPLHRELAAAAPAAFRHGALSPPLLVEAVRAALLRHAAGRLADDVAVLVLSRDVRVPAQSRAAPLLPHRYRV